MRTAIIGLPMVGKTSLFTILTGPHQQTRLGTMEARVGVARVPDPRVDALARLFQPQKVTYATVEYVDFPSISREVLQDPGYLASLRLADALAHVLRLFQSETVPHEKGSIEPLRDAAEVETELILSDLMMVEKRLERLEKDRKKMKSAELDHEFRLLEQVRAALESGRPLRGLELSPEDEKRLRGFQFLTQKPLLYVLNVGEEDAPRLHEIEEEFRKGPLAAYPRTAVTAIAGKLEAELAELGPDEARQYLESFGLKESGLERLIAATYSLLGLMSVLTGSETEVRAWAIPLHTPALKAAGAIHTDFEKKFIRAEVVNWKDLVESGGFAGARERGLLRVEGKDYIVKDGDVLLIRHG
ncbi:MAG: YchF family ATPase [Bryobacteraceae bacterium]|jgi:GTP-binding protein YchF|nr:YchF family ATPase [Bryobacteraceae bacterium]